MFFLPGAWRLPKSEGAFLQVAEWLASVSFYKDHSMQL